MTTSELKTLIETVTEDDLHCYFGVRTQDEPFEMGAMDHVSHVWVDGEETDEELDGVSVTDIDSRKLRMHCDDYNALEGRYAGSHCAIIAGNRAEMGEDEGEIVIQDPVVIYIIK